MLTFTTLASGSGGNAALVSDGDSFVLLDAGISARRITNALNALGVPRLDAVLITHEHSDHVSGLDVLSRRTGAPIAASGPTCAALGRKYPGLAGLLLEQKPGTGIKLGGLSVESFPTPHDAAGSVGYSISGRGARLVLCTDLGHVTREVEDAALGCDLLVCEMNHDVDWLMSGPYPSYLKQRILGDRGHLSNEDGAELAARAARAGTKAVVLAHLSAQNNTPGRALDAAERRLRAEGLEPGRDLSLRVAPRSEPGPTYRLDGEGAVLC